MSSKPVITICASASFYRQAVAIESELISLGLAVKLPEVCRRMKDSGDFDVSHYKTWFAKASDYKKKTALMLEHFKKVVESDAILVLNYEKHGQHGYVGGNVLMEMGLALQFARPIFILNPVNETSSYLEELLGMQPTILDGDLELIPVAFKRKKRSSIALPRVLSA